MSQDDQYPERGYNTEDVAALNDTSPPKKSFVRRHWGKVLLAAVVGIPAVGLTLWTVIAMAYTYSAGDRTGFLQKFSEKGWLCKTYEGEIAMVNVPGQIAEKFQFTVRDDSVADLINKAQGKRVAITYKEHRGLPTSCFGETNYFVNGVRVLAP